MTEQEKLIHDTKHLCAEVFRVISEFKKEVDKIMKKILLNEQEIKDNERKDKIS